MEQTQEDTSNRYPALRVIKQTSEKPMLGRIQIINKQNFNLQDLRMSQSENHIHFLRLIILDACIYYNTILPLAVRDIGGPKEVHLQWQDQNECYGDKFLEHVSQQTGGN